LRFDYSAILVPPSTCRRDVASAWSLNLQEHRVERRIRSKARDEMEQPHELTRGSVVARTGDQLVQRGWKRFVAELSYRLTTGIS
jgi:hypothetical protein